MSRETFHLIHLWDDDRVDIEFAIHDIEFRHPRCRRSSVQLSLAEFRNVETVTCPKCGKVVGAFSEMVGSLDEKLRFAASEKDRKRRAMLRRDALEQHRRLLEG